MHRPEVESSKSRHGLREEPFGSQSPVSLPQPLVHCTNPTPGHVHAGAKCIADANFPPDWPAARGRQPEMPLP